METTTKKLTKKQENEQDKARAKEDLLFELNALPGEKKVVATICTHVSRS